MTAYYGAINRGRVTRMEGGAPWVEVPSMGGGQEMGPCDTLGDLSTLAAGDSVLVVQVDDVPDDLVVLGRLVTAD